jgi:SAM-dependent methyltransferase
MAARRIKESAGCAGKRPAGGEGWKAARRGMADDRQAADGEADLNRDMWTEANAEYTQAHAARAWAAEEITWGIFNIAERQVGVLGDVADLDVIELGCGTAYFSAWLARRGARPVGVDVTPAQLRTARECQRQTGIIFPLIEADAVDVPLRGASFDLVISECGASLWCDPARWVPEAARLLRPGGRLVFHTTSVLSAMCLPDDPSPCGAELLHPQRKVARLRSPGGGVEFHPGHGDWIATLRRAGFIIEALHELYAPPGATDHPYYNLATAAWAQQWPAEELWATRLRPTRIDAPG